MPKRQHFLKFQASIPVSATKQSQRAYQKVLDAAVSHLKALAGGAAFNVEVKAVYQDRGPGQTGIVWRDLLVVVGFDGPLTNEGKKLAIERKQFEFTKATGTASPLDFGGTAKPGKVILQ
jgi:hypothetical protein